MNTTIVRQLTKGFFSFACVFVINSIIPTAVGEAATYYVAKSGNDGNSCSQARSQSTAKLTVNSGVKCLSAGDKLYIKAGTYVESLLNVIPGGTSWSSPVVVASFPGDAVTIKGKTGASQVIRIAGSSKKYIIVDGLILDAINVGYSGIKFDTVGGLASHHIRIQNSEIKNSQDAAGILTTRDSHYNEFINLNVHHNGMQDDNNNGKYPYGFYILGKHNVIENCRIWSNGGTGIHIYNGYTDASDYNIIRNNIISGNGTKTTSGGTGGVIIGAGKGNLVYNNIVYNNFGYGIRHSRNAKSFNNTIYNNQDMAIELAYSGGSSEVRNNIFWGNGTDAVVNHGTGTPTTSNNLTSNPRFLDAGGFDFRLENSSPAIDSGINLVSYFDFDFDGVSSKRDSNFDIGAYEFKGAGNDDPPLPPTNLRVTASQ